MLALTLTRDESYATMLLYRLRCLCSGIFEARDDSPAEDGQGWGLAVGGRGRRSVKCHFRILFAAGPDGEGDILLPSLMPV